MKVAGYSINQASLISLVTLIVGLIIAVVPSWAPEKELLIGIGGGAISVAFLIANAIHVHAGAKPSVASLAPLTQNILGAVKAVVKDVEKVAAGKPAAPPRAKAASNGSAPAKATSTTAAAKS